MKTTHSKQYDEVPGTPVFDWGGKKMYDTWYLVQINPDLTGGGNQAKPKM